MTKWFWNYQWLSWILFSGGHAWDNDQVAREMNIFTSASTNETHKKYKPQVVILGDYSDTINDWGGQVALLNHQLRDTDLNRAKETVWDLKYGTFQRSTDSIMQMSGKETLRIALSPSSLWRRQTFL